MFSCQLLTLVVADGAARHLGRDHTLAGELELGDGAAPTAQRLARRWHRKRLSPLSDRPVAGLDLLVLAARPDPALPQPGKPLSHVNGHLGIGVGTAGIIDAEWRGFLRRA